MRRTRFEMCHIPFLVLAGVSLLLDTAIAVCTTNKQENGKTRYILATFKRRTLVEQTIAYRECIPPYSVIQSRKSVNAAIIEYSVLNAG